MTCAAFTFFAAALLLPAIGYAEEPATGEPRSRLYFHVAWPEGITYEVRKISPSLEEVKPLSYLQDVYLLGRVGLRLDIDAAAFAADDSPHDFDNDIRVRRAKFYLLGDFSLGIPIGYKFEFSFEGRNVFLNDFYLRWKPPRWVDSVDFGYVTPPMGLENVVSSRTLTFMEVAAPVQALAPGFRSGVAAAGHVDAWRAAWKLGIFSAGQEQISGDASDTSGQVVGRFAWLPWRASPQPDAAFLHLGLSGSYVFTGNSKIQYRARPESFIAPFVVDTGDVRADSAFQVAVEAAWNDGPRLVSGEFLHSSVAASSGFNHNFYGMYALAAWFLTGERHPYNTRTGLFERPQPLRPFSFRARRWGALEVGQRVSWLDLTDGNVPGGRMLTLTSGLAWYLNSELKFCANYVFSHVGDGAERGNANIFQMRLEVGI